MIAALTSLKRYFYEKADRQEDSDFYYFRTRTPPDDTDFQPCVTENRNGAFSGIKYFNPQTRELTHFHPSDRQMDVDRYGFKPEQVFKTIMKGTAIGFVASGASILLGYHIITLGKGTIIGFSISAAKAFWDSLGWDDDRICVCKNEKIIAMVRHPNGGRWGMPIEDEKEQS